MDFRENIRHAGRTFAKTMRPKRREEMYQDVPYFEIFKNDMNKYDVRIYNFETHDNADRMALYQHYLRDYILPNVTGNVCGFYNIELHDSYTYLPTKEHGYKDAFTFSKFKDDTRVVLLPDPYMVCNWGNALTNVKDDVPWENKMNKACFFGTTTGIREPSKNKRIMFCRDHIDDAFVVGKITKIAQMTKESIVTAIGEDTFLKIYNPTPVSVPEQCKFKFQIVMDGNTSRFDVWSYQTNCLNIKMASDEMLWYYPMLMEDVHFVGAADKNSLRSKIVFCLQNADYVKRYIQNAHHFARNIFKPLSHMQYTTAVFDTIAENL